MVVLGAPSMRTALLVLLSDAVPLAFGPMKLPWMTFPEAPAPVTCTPYDEAPEMRLQAPAQAVFGVVLSIPPMVLSGAPEISTMETVPPMAAVPSAFVPM